MCFTLNFLRDQQHLDEKEPAQSFGQIQNSMCSDYYERRDFETLWSHKWEIIVINVAGSAGFRSQSLPGLELLLSSGGFLHRKPQWACSSETLDVRVSAVFSVPVPPSPFQATMNKKNYSWKQINELRFQLAVTLHICTNGHPAKTNCTKGLLWYNFINNMLANYWRVEKGEKCKMQKDEMREWVNI